MFVFSLLKCSKEKKQYHESSDKNKATIVACSIIFDLKQCFRQLEKDKEENNQCRMEGREEERKKKGRNRIRTEKKEEWKRKEYKKSEKRERKKKREWEKRKIEKVRNKSY